MTIATLAAVLVVLTVLIQNRKRDPRVLAFDWIIEVGWLVVFWVLVWQIVERL